MVARYWCFTGRTLKPGYFRVNILDMLDDGQMFVTQHQVPMDATFEDLIHWLNRSRNAHSEIHEDILRLAHKIVDDAAIKCSGAQRTAALRLRETLRLGVFKFDAPESERRRWYFVMHNKAFGNPYVIPAGGQPYLAHNWKLVAGANAMSRIKESAAQGHLPVFARVSDHGSSHLNQSVC